MAADDSESFASGLSGGAASSEAAPTIPAAAAFQQASRRIIYDAEITVIVTDFSAAEQGIARLVKDHGGYLADVAIDRASGEWRSGHWVARIPVDRFDSFLEEVADLGVPTSRRQNAQDVTEEYVDLEARIANAKRLEERILSLLNQSTGEIKDVIEVEHELSRIRGEVEQMQGRLKYLTNRTDMTTVTITAREERDYVPPQAPTLSGRATTAWSDSLLALKNVGADLLVSLIYAAPWLAVLTVILLPLVWIARLLYKRRQTIGTT
jgi:hypothetical protein